MESIRQATVAARGATNDLHTLTAICVNLTSLEGSLADEQRAARTQLIEDVIAIQRQLSSLKMRAEALFGSVADFPPKIVV
ncbi:MAG TPA: hypothetical protein VFN25_08530 [Dokdonella sp.]|uniref:hypothetical protein n=1 Tax=Dokdonella sp. TaxID=2291710 RepID=UPI002D80B360|nr:hypothetical protein [Dokdonella sp.]HET9032937.1 hypothetical protein [Dokdonella sp.]